MTLGAVQDAIDAGSSLSALGIDEIEAGLRRGWYPVARSSEVAGPVPARILGVNLVVYRDSGGIARVTSSQCPHRGADLAMGTVVGDALRCPYHGWSWSGVSGRCVSIPALAPGSPIPPAARIKTYEAREAYGLVWTSICDTPLGDPPRFEEFDGLDWAGDFVSAPPWDVPGNICMAIEGFRDLAHFPFVHEATMGPTPHEVPPLNARRDGFHAYLEWTQARVDAGTADAAFAEAYAEEGQVQYHAIAPSAVATLITSAAFPPRVLLFAVAPTSLEESRWYLLERVCAGFPVPVEELLDVGARITDEDVVIFERIRPRGFEGMSSQVHCAADAYTLKYRQAFMAFVEAAALAT